MKKCIYWDCGWCYNNDPFHIYGTCPGFKKCNSYKPIEKSEIMNDKPLKLNDTTQQDIIYKMLTDTIAEIDKVYPETPTALLIGLLDLLKDEIKLSCAE